MARFSTFPIAWQYSLRTRLKPRNVELQYISHCLAIQSPHTSQKAQCSASVHFPLPGNTVSAHVSKRAVFSFNTFPIAWQYKLRQRFKPRNVQLQNIPHWKSQWQYNLRTRFKPRNCPLQYISHWNSAHVSIHFPLPGNTISAHTHRWSLPDTDYYQPIYRCQKS